MNADEKEIINNISNISNKNEGRKKINLPNKMTIFRVILVPVFMVFILIPFLGDVWSRILAAALILIAAITDLIDGIIARKLNLITDFGKLMDPLADKFMIAGAMLAITASKTFADISYLTVWATAIIFFRELAVISIRLVANSSEGNVIAANFAGKFKMFSQCVCVLTILLEDMVITKNIHTPPYLFSYMTTAFMLIATVFSGVVYFKIYWRYIDPTK